MKRGSVIIQKKENVGKVNVYSGCRHIFFRLSAGFIIVHTGLRHRFIRAVIYFSVVDFRDIQNNKPGQSLKSTSENAIQI